MFWSLNLEISTFYLQLSIQNVWGSSCRRIIKFDDAGPLFTDMVGQKLGQRYMVITKDKHALSPHKL